MLVVIQSIKNLIKYQKEDCHSDINMPLKKGNNNFSKMSQN